MLLDEYEVVFAMFRHYHRFRASAQVESKMPFGFDFVMNDESSATWQRRSENCLVICLETAMILLRCVLADGTCRACKMPSAKMMWTRRTVHAQKVMQNIAKIHLLYTETHFVLSGCKCQFWQGTRSFLYGQKQLRLPCIGRVGFGLNHEQVPQLCMTPLHFWS